MSDLCRIRLQHDVTLLPESVSPLSDEMYEVPSPPNQQMLASCVSQQLTAKQKREESWVYDASPLTQPLQGWPNIGTRAPGWQHSCFSVTDRLLTPDSQSEGWRVYVFSGWLIGTLPPMWVSCLIIIIITHTQAEWTLTPCFSSAVRGSCDTVWIHCIKQTVEPWNQDRGISIRLRTAITHIQRHIYVYTYTHTHLSPRCQTLTAERFRGVLHLCSLDIDLVL